jgi:hypothetical protein
VVSEIHGSHYHPRSVTVEFRDGRWCVVDRSYGCDHVVPYASHPDAERVAKVRRATIKGALTRRANKRQRSRVEACATAGVTWSWLRETMTVAEADAWLGLD